MMDDGYLSPLRQIRSHFEHTGKKQPLPHYHCQYNKNRFKIQQSSKSFENGQSKRRKCCNSTSKYSNVARNSLYLSDMEENDSIDISTMEYTPRLNKDQAHSDNEYTSAKSDIPLLIDKEWNNADIDQTNMDGECYQTPRKSWIDRSYYSGNASNFVSVSEDSSPIHDLNCPLLKSNESPAIVEQVLESPKSRTPVVTLSPHTPENNPESYTAPSTPQAPLRVRRSRRSLLNGLMNADAVVLRLALEADDDPNAEICLPSTYRPFYRDSACLPLLLAAMTIQPDMIKILLQYGAAVNSVNSRNQSAAHILCQTGLSECHQASRLSSNYMTYNKGDNGSPCSNIENQPARIECLSVLLDNDIDISIIDLEGRTAIEYAKDSSLHQVVQFLQQNIKVESNLDTTEFTPLKVANAKFVPFPQLDQDLTPCEKIARPRAYFNRDSQKNNIYQDKGKTQPEYQQTRHVRVQQY